MDSTFIGLHYNTWRFVNTFAPWFSAIGTIAVLITTIYLIRKDKSYYIDVDFFDEIKDGIGYLYLRITNLGSTKAVLKAIKVVYSINSDNKYFWRDFLSKDFGDTELPKIIKEDEILIYKLINFNELYDYLRNEKWTITEIYFSVKVLKDGSYNFSLPNDLLEKYFKEIFEPPEKTGKNFLDY